MENLSESGKVLQNVKEMDLNMLVWFVEVNEKLVEVLFGDINKKSEGFTDPSENSLLGSEIPKLLGKRLQKYLKNCTSHYIR